MNISTIRVELTNKCNLSCKHCLRTITPSSKYIPINSILRIINQAKPYNIKDIRLTGGEPTLHPQFEEILSIFSNSGYIIKLVTNGKNFSKIYKKITRFRNNIGEIRFSLDGAKESTHDKNRGNGSYRHIMEAIEICQREKLLFSLIMIITRLNKNELGQVAQLAIKSGSKNLFFAHLQPTPRVIRNKLRLSPIECLLAEKEVYELRNNYKEEINIEFCMGFYIKNPFYICRIPLSGFNIDYRGIFNYCIQLSSLDNNLNGYEIIGNLKNMSFLDVHKKLLNKFILFSKRKIQNAIKNKFSELDHFPCQYCIRYFALH